MELGELRVGCFHQILTWAGTAVEDVAGVGTVKQLGVSSRVKGFVHSAQRTRMGGKSRGEVKGLGLILHK